MRKCCDNCKWFTRKLARNNRGHGECIDALQRARKVVPSTVILSKTSSTYADWGEDCPAYEEGENRE